MRLVKVQLMLTTIWFFLVRLKGFFSYAKTCLICLYYYVCLYGYLTNQMGNTRCYPTE